MNANADPAKGWRRSLAGAVLGSATGVSALLLYTNGLFVAGLTQDYGLTRVQFGFGVLLVMMMAYGVMPTWHLLAVPPLVLIAGLLALSVSMWLGPINVRYRDVKHTLTFLLQIWMYASPVVYSFQMIPDEWKWAYALNPMVGVIEGFRWAVFGEGNPDVIAMGVGGALMLILLFGGLLFFKRMERSFADLI